MRSTCHQEEQIVILVVSRDEKRERRQPEMVIARSRGRHRRGIDYMNVHSDGEPDHNEGGEDVDYCGDNGIDNIDYNFNDDLTVDSLLFTGWSRRRWRRGTD